MDEVGQRIQEYQQAIEKRNEYITQLSASLQSTIQQRDDLRSSAQQEAHRFAHEINVLKEQLQETSAFLRNKDFSGVNAAEFIQIKNQLIALNADNSNQSAQIASLSQNLDAKSQALLNLEASTAQLKSTQKEEHEELERVRAVVTGQQQALQEQQQQLQSQLSGLQQALAQSRVEKAALEESFSKERAQLASRVDQCTSQLSDQSLLDESLSVTQQRVSDLTSQLESVACQLNGVTAAAAHTEVALRDKIRHLEEQLTDSSATAEKAGPLLTAELEEKFGQQLNQVTAELRAESQQQLAESQQQLTERQQQLAGCQQQLTERQQQLAGCQQQLTERQQLLAGCQQQLTESQQQLAESQQQLTERQQQLSGCQQQLTESKQQLQLVTQARDALMQQLQVLTGKRNTLKQQLESISEERNTLTQQLVSVSEERNTLAQQLAAVSEERGTLIQRLESISHERNELTQELKSISDERSTLTLQLASVCEERSTLTLQLASVSEERITLTRQFESVSEERNALTQELQSTSEGRSLLTQQLALVVEERDLLTQRLEIVGQVRVEAGSQLTESNQQRDQLCHALEATVQQRDELSRQLAAAIQQTTELGRAKESAHQAHGTIAGQLEVKHRQHEESSRQLESVGLHRDQLNQQLVKASQQQVELSRQLVEMTQQRDTLVGELRQTSHDGENVAQQLKTAAQTRAALEQRLTEVNEQHDSVSRQRDSVVQKRNALAQERTSLAHDRDTLAQERDSLSVQLVSAGEQAAESGAVVRRSAAEVARHQAAAAHLQTERAELRRTLDTVVGERTRLVAAVEAVSGERARLAAALDTAVQEKQRLSEALDKATGEKAQLTDALSTAAGEKALLSEAFEAVSGEKARLAEDISAVSSEKTRLAEALEEASSEKCRLADALDTATAEKVRLAGALEAVSGEKVQLAEALETVVGERAQLVETLEVTTTEKSHLTVALEAVSNEQARLIEALEAERRIRTTSSEELMSRLAEGEAAAIQLKSQLAEKESAGTQLAGQLEEKETVAAELSSQLAEKEASAAQLTGELGKMEATATQLASQLATAEAELSVQRDQLARLTTSEAGLRDRLTAAETELTAVRQQMSALAAGDRSAAKNANNTAIRLRARAEMTSRRLEEAERRVDELERERAMLVETHERYARQTTAQLAVADAEVEKLRTCQLVHGLTSPRRESVTLLRDGVAPSRKDDSMSPRKVDATLLNTDDVTSPRRESAIASRRVLFGLNSPTREARDRTSPAKRAISPGAEMLEAMMEPGEVYALLAAACLSADSGTVTPRSAADSGLTSLSGRPEPSAVQPSRRESRAPTAASPPAPDGRTGRRRGEPAAAGEEAAPRPSGAVAALVRRLASRLAAAQCDRRRLLRRLERHAARAAESGGQSPERRRSSSAETATLEVAAGPDGVGCISGSQSPRHFALTAGSLSSPPSSWPGHFNPVCASLSPKHAAQKVPNISDNVQLSSPSQANREVTSPSQAVQEASSPCPAEQEALSASRVMQKVPGPSPVPQAPSTYDVMQVSNASNLVQEVTGASDDTQNRPESPSQRDAATKPSCSEEATQRVISALAASERDQERLLQLETRVSDRLAELRRDYKASVHHSATQSADIVLIDSSYEVRLLKEKLAACGSISAALHAQLHQHRGLLLQLLQLFAAAAADSRQLGSPPVPAPDGRARRGLAGSLDAEVSQQLGGPDWPTPSPSSESDGDSLPPDSARDAGQLSDPGPRLASDASPRLREAPLSARSLREAALTEPQLLPLTERRQLWQSPPWELEFSQLRAVSADPSIALDALDDEAEAPQVPPLDVGRWAKSARTGAGSPADGAVQRDATGSPDRRAEPPAAVAGRCHSADPATPEQPPADHPAPLDESPLADPALLELLVRENGTLRRALLYEKQRGQRLLAAETESRGRCERWSAALTVADQRQARLLDCVERQQQAITRLQKSVGAGDPCTAVPDLTSEMTQCREALRAHSAALAEHVQHTDKAPEPEPDTEHREEIGRALATRKLELDEANHLLSLRDRELDSVRSFAERLSGDCERLRRANSDLTNRLRRSEASLAHVHREKRRCDWLCRKLDGDVRRSELVMDLERALWQVESQHQLMEHEQRIYQHFLASAPGSAEGTPTDGSSPEPAPEVWLFPAGEPRAVAAPVGPAGVISLPRPPPPPPDDVPAEGHLVKQPAQGAASPREQQEAGLPSLPSLETILPGDKVVGCADLLSRLDDAMQTEFHRMVQAISVRWTRRSLQELQRAQTELQLSADSLQADSLQRERERLQEEVRHVQRWLETTYLDVLTEVDARLHDQRSRILQAEADVLQKADTLSQDPRMLSETLQRENQRLQLNISELEQQHGGLRDQIAAHEEELDSLREYFEEKVKFTEKMYSDEMRRLIQQQAQAESAAEPEAIAQDGLEDLVPELDGNFTNVGLPEGDDSVGPSVLRLRVQFERRVATLRQQLERKLSSRTRDVRTELERKHRQEITELERKHLAKMAQTVERYKKEIETNRRENEKQTNEVKNKLIQQHQDEVNLLTQKRQKQAVFVPGGGGGDGGPDASPDADGRRQMLLAELETLSEEMKRRNQAEQETFLEQQRLAMERFARQQEKAVRQLEGRQQAARDETAQAERELAQLRAESAEAEIRRDQEAARWKLELAAGYETQIKAVLAGVSLDEETACSVARLQLQLQRDGGLALSELETANQAALQAREAHHQRQHRELRLQLEAATRRERHLQLEQARQRVQDQLWTGSDSATVEVAREELELLHRDRENQAEHLQQLSGLVRVLCQYYQSAERLYRPPAGSLAADPEAEATDQMVLAALAPDEGVSLWAARGRHLPRVERCVRDATARLQEAAVTAGDTTGDGSRLRRAERRGADLQLRVDGLSAELQTTRLQLAGLQERLDAGEEREALGESRQAGGSRRPPPPSPPETTLQHIKDAAEALLTSPADPADSRLLLSRVHQLEALLSELASQSDQVVAECSREVDDVKQQMVAANKQLRASRSFLDELTAEREAERDEFGREQARLTELVAARERERDEQAFRRRQLESVEAQNAELLMAGQESEQERSRLRDELKAAVAKIQDLRDIIRSLESHVDELTQTQEAADAHRLKKELARQTATCRQLQTQLASCTCGGGGERTARPAAAPHQTAPANTPALNSTADSDDTSMSVCPSLLQELRDQILKMESHVDKRVETLENSFASAQETVSPANSQVELSHQHTGDELARLRHKLERLAVAEEATLARVHRLETELGRSQAHQQDLVLERDALQRQLGEQLLQLSALRARLQRSRLAAEAGAEPTDWRGRIAFLQAELDAAVQLMRAKEKQLADQDGQLDETRRKLVVREAELARLSRDRERAESAPTAPAASPAASRGEAAELRAVKEKYRALQLKHQELMAQLRENNLPEFVERLLSDKNEQIEDLELNIRSLALQSMRSSSAGDRTPGLPEVVNASLLSEHQYSPEVLRHAATSASSDAAELSRPDLSMLPDKQEPARPASPTASDHSWDSAPTVAGSAGATRSSAGSELATSAVTSSSSDSIQHLRAALKRKKQLLNSRKQQLEQGRQGAALQPAVPDDVENPAVSPPQSALSPPQSALSPPQSAVSPPQSALSPPQPAVSPPQPAAGPEQLVRLQQLEHLRARLDVLNPILIQLDRDYTAMMDSVADQKMTASETELRLMAEVAEMRQTIEQQDAARSQLQQHVQQLRGQGVPDSDPLLRSVEEQLLAILRDMEINKLEACGKMHETSALLARTQRQSQQQDGDNGSELVSSGYISMSPRTASEGPPPPPPPPPSLPSSQAWHETTNAETGSESTFHSDTARSDPGYSADKFSCPSLTDEQMSDLGDINEEVDQLRARIGELERELGQRGDAPTRDPSDGQWRDRLDSERAAWSRERQHLQQVITRLDEEQERQRRLGARSGDGDEARVQQANGRYLRSESFRRALCWQKRYLMVLLGGYQDTETMTLERMTLLTGGTFWPDGRSYLSPLRKFRAAALVLVAIRRMGYMVNRWRSAGRLVGAPTVSWHPAVPRPAPAVRPLSPASFVSESSRDADAELNALDRIVRDCAGSAPNLHDRPDAFDARSVVTVSDVCTDDLEPYLARFDALLERQGYPPQSGSQR